MTEAQEENAEKIAATKAALVDAVKAALATAKDHPIRDYDEDIIRKAGEDLNGLGGDALMRRTFNEVVEPYEEPEYGHAVNLIDKAWHGVGHWLA
jgi:hypothetical protein